MDYQRPVTVRRFLTCSGILAFAFTFLILVVWSLSRYTPVNLDFLIALFVAALFSLSFCGLTFGFKESSQYLLQPKATNSNENLQKEVGATGCRSSQNSGNYPDHSNLLKTTKEVPQNNKVQSSPEQLSVVYLLKKVYQERN